MDEKIQAKNKTGKLAKSLGGLVGLGALVLAGKKLLDLYSQGEDGNNISPEAYMRELAEKRSHYGDQMDLDFFDYGLIEGQGPGSQFFREFLRALNRHWELPSQVLRISDIEKILDFSQSDFQDPDQYARGVLEFLGGIDLEGRDIDLEGRDQDDFIIYLASSGLKKIFQEELASQDGDNYLWRAYGQARFIINPIYIRDKFK